MMYGQRGARVQTRSRSSALRLGSALDQHCRIMRTRTDSSAGKERRAQNDRPPQVVIWFSSSASNFFLEQAVLDKLSRAMRTRTDSSPGKGRRAQNDRPPQDCHLVLRLCFKLFLLVPKLCLGSHLSQKLCFKNRRAQAVPGFFFGRQRARIKSNLQCYGGFSAPKNLLADRRWLR
jgi:hypothetical protein